VGPIAIIAAKRTSRAAIERPGQLARREKGELSLNPAAKNLTGYHNLVRLTKGFYTEGFYYKPRIDKELG